MDKTCSKLSLKVVYHDFKRDKNRSGLDVTIKGCYISLICLNYYEKVTILNKSRT